MSGQAGDGRKRRVPRSLTRQLRRARVFKRLLFVGAILLAGGLFLATHLLVDRVRDSARSYLMRSVEMYRTLLVRGNPELAFEAVQGIDFPLVLTDAEGTPKAWRNLGLETEDPSPGTLEQVREFVEEMRRQGNEPVAVEVLPGQVDYFHYGDPKTVRLLKWLSVTIALAVALYVFVGYAGFRMIRKAEERSVWVGMARETAHQLGTPISSLMGWLEVMGDREPDIAEQMRRDVKRLEKIAVRFSKIGTREELREGDLAEAVLSAVDYMRARVGTSVALELEVRERPTLRLQPELIGWVVENLVRNAAQAMEGRGTIGIVVDAAGDEARVDVSDQGVGISPGDQETIFRPGYTTKSRGWGLGLSLGRRIVEEMHRGRLYVLNSRPGEGTTIRMVLPR